MTSIITPAARSGRSVRTLGPLLVAVCLAGCEIPSAVNHAPVAFAGYDRDATLGDSVVLDGMRSSDPDGNALSFSWTVQLPDGVREALGTQAVVSYTPLSEGVFLFFLQVDDGALRSAPDLLTVRVRSSSPAAQLIARAGQSQARSAGATIPLDGSGSSGPSGAVLDYQWEVVDWPDGAVPGADYQLEVDVNSPELAQFRHLNPALPGAFVISLRVRHAGIESDADHVTLGFGLWGQAVRAEAQPAARVALGADLSSPLNLEAQLFAPTGALAGTPMEWWVLAAPAGEGCPGAGDLLTEGATLEGVEPLITARLRTTVSCAGTWQILICPQRAAPECPAPGLCCDRSDGSVPLTASCCAGLADRLTVTVEEFAP